MMDSWLSTWIKTPVIFGVLALVVATYFYFKVMKLGKGTETMERIAFCCWSRGYRSWCYLYLFQRFWR